MDEIKDFPGYFIDREGNVYNKNKTIKKCSIDRGGYCVTWLRKDGKSKPVLVHRLVALQYLPQTDEYVNHKDGNKLNNKVDNLEWCSAKFNAQHRDKLHPHMYDHLNKTKIPVRCVETGEVFSSYCDVVKRFGGSVTNIKPAILKGWRHMGYHFEFVNKE